MFVMATVFSLLLSPPAEKVTKERRTGGEVSFAKKQTSRIFAPFNILPLVDPPLAVEGGREQLIKVKYL